MNRIMMTIISNRRISKYLSLSLILALFFFWIRWNQVGWNPSRIFSSNDCGGVGGGGSSFVNDDQSLPLSSSGLSKEDYSFIDDSGEYSGGRPIKCKVNDKVSKNLGRNEDRPQEFQCRILESSSDSSKQIFVPASFLKKYFEVTSEIKKPKNLDGGEGDHQQVVQRPDDLAEYVSLSTSYSKVFPHFKTQKYNYNGSFLQFGNFDVESRPRVKCVSASKGVPVSTQWDKNGYYYSTQISQFALSHFSQHLDPLTPGKTQTIYENGKEDETADWSGDTTRVSSLNCIHYDKPISLKLDNSKEHILRLSLQNKDNASFALELTDGIQRFILQYVPENFFFRRRGNLVTYGYGNFDSETKWKHFTIDLKNDLNKGFNNKKLNHSKINLNVIKIKFNGVGCLTNLSLANHEHLAMFLNGAEWLIDNQDSRGGWPVSVTFNQDKFKYQGAAEIPPGWYSAMASGHALSVLSRAYLTTKDERFLSSAVKAVELYDTPSNHGGVKAKFMDKFIWFEEYPTNPPSFVLNGFMYSLIGLYDLDKTLKNSGQLRNEIRNLTSSLLTEGMTSLIALLPLYDTGSGSVYDLRHFTMSGEPPKIARWDYHSTHINLLYTLSTFDGIPNSNIFTIIGDRWTDYMLAKHSNHN